MSDTQQFDELKAEMRRTAFQKKAVSRLGAKETLEYAITYFQNAGYRAGKTGRPNQVFIMGGREGKLPRVTGEIKLQTDVGKGKVTMVTMDSAGEKLHDVMKAFHASFRTLGREDNTQEIE